MMEKKWHDEIPAGGVLCKKEIGAIVLVEKLKGAVVVIKGGVQMYPEDLTPLTATEWWEFAPWKDMDSAPQNGWFLVIENCTGEIKLAKRYLDDEFIDEFNHRIVFKKWLPLPPQVI